MMMKVWIYENHVCELRSKELKDDDRSFNSSICSPHNYMIFIYSKLQNKISWKAKIGLEVKRRGREKINLDVRISISNEGALAE